ncbi:TlpA family protein disulfide reductase [Pedobacter changchengzhani]|uniref:TlpA family protein disulfide reductase n=1 Tax=Pedobacter changchengzhani TaxID=2529274 RepID=A0A4R5MHK5_9SPHI|nr:TlpA disulfide reductase family protein [Pedobacter changchengzhani]TDG34961.1 TlpA family protein disulfide reductase [Pedobacter changchengzhani]
MKKVACFLLISFFATSIIFGQSKILKIGQIAPKIALPTPNGDTITLSSLKGKLVLIDFWATWCAPCVKEQPELKALYVKHANQVKAGKFEILGVSLDKNKENWEKSIEHLKIDWPQVSDLKFWKSQVAKDYAIEDLPFNVLVNEDGLIVAINLHEKKLVNFIDDYLNAKIKQP